MFGDQKYLLLVIGKIDTLENKPAIICLYMIELKLRFQLIEMLHFDFDFI